MTEGVLYGIHAVAGLLRRNAPAVRAIWLARDTRNERLGELETLAAQAGVSVTRLAREEVEQRARSPHHQGVCAQIDLSRIVLGEGDLDAALAAIEGPPLFLVLDGVQDPHNLGACLRTADAAGAHGLIVPRDRAAGLTPAVFKVASGAVGSVPFFQVTNLARALRRLREADVWLVGAEAGAEMSLYQADLVLPVALVMGAEGAGLRRLTREHCDWLVSIPMAGAVESLNISVAAAVCLFEARRQRIKGSNPRTP
jgi:23S rRNA (guanosine2251-2'-O)-methyltransferase